MEKVTALEVALFRACAQCATARMRCSGSSPCGRCIEKDITCTYPKSTKRKTRKRLAPKKEKTAQLTSEETGDASRQVSLALSQEQLVPAWQAGHSERLRSLDISRSESFGGSLHNSGIRQQPEPSGEYSDTPWLMSSDYILPTQGPILHTYPSDMYNTSIQSANHFSMQGLADFGCSTINWLSATDFSYEQFDFENPYFVINNFQEDMTSQNAQQSSNPDQQIITASRHSQNSPQSHPTMETPRSTTGSGAHATPARDSDSQGTRSTPSKSSTYYVDGAGAREPRYGKFRKGNSHWRPNRTASDLMNPENNCDFMFTPLTEQLINRESNNGLQIVSQEVYDRILLEFRIHCLGTLHAFKSEYFPPLDVLNQSVHLYLEFFHPVFPLVHRASLISKRCSDIWHLVLAMSAIGVNYLGNKIASRCSNALFEFLQRSLDHIDNSVNTAYNTSYLNMGIYTYQHSSTAEIFQLQAQVISVLGMLNTCNDTLIERAYTGRSKLVTTCLRRKLLSGGGYTQTSIETVSWQEWIERESQIRTAYSIWVRSHF